MSLHSWVGSQATWNNSGCVRFSTISRLTIGTVVFRYTSVSLRTVDALEKFATLRFQVKYKSAPEKLDTFWMVWKVLLCVLLGVAGLFWFAALYQHGGASRADTLEFQMLFYGFFKAAELSSQALTVLLLLVSVFFWLITFKFQRLEIFPDGPYYVIYVLTPVKKIHKKWSVNVL